MKKKIIFYLLDFLNMIWSLFPAKLRFFFFKSFVALESRGNPRQSLKNLFIIHDNVEKFINQSAIRYEGFHHPKHRLTEYHKFFINNIEDGTKVLDVGCGHGYVSSKVAESKKLSLVIGVDRVKSKIQFARNQYKLPNLKFICEDVLDSKFSEKYDIIILSNIIEHIDKRVDFMKLLIRNCNPMKIIFRIPDFRRSWFLPLKKELGINYFSDSEHFIEPTYEEYANEVTRAGMDIKHTIFIWGEIWSVCQVKSIQ